MNASVDRPITDTARRAWHWVLRRVNSLRPAPRPPLTGVFCDPQLEVDPSTGGAIRFRPRAKLKAWKLAQ